MINNNSNIIIALDYTRIEPVYEKLQQLNHKQCCIKVGKILFTRYEPSIVEKIVDAEFKVFLYLKFHDVSRQIASTVKTASEQENTI